MKSKVLGSVSLLFLLTLASPAIFKAPSQGKISSSPQEIPVKKPKYDYMSTFLSRSTNPLGLKEDLMLKKLLQQARVKWAVRAGSRHILD